MSTKRKREGVERESEGVVSSRSVSLEALTSPDFEELARRFPDFGRAWKEAQDARLAQRQRTGSTVSLASVVSPSFSVALTKALLHVYFGLSLAHVPEDRLCPPVPNRFFYVRWIQETLLPMLASNEYFLESATASSSSHPPVGLDVGTGATCIYPLLFAASSSSSVQLLATDVDSESVRIAQRNVAANPGVASRIRVLLVPPSTRQQQSSSTDRNFTPEVLKGPLLTSLEHLPLPVDFCMTNPPFYNDQDELARTAPRQGDQRTRAPMTALEGSYPGAEVGFVMDMICDGLFLYLQTTNNRRYKNPEWSSCMCGKKTSLIQVQRWLEQLLGYAHVTTTEFGPGHMTRWFLAWTFRRPTIRSPLAHRDEWDFAVWNEHQPVVVGEVYRRIEYFALESFPACPLVCTRSGARNEVMILQQDLSATSPDFNALNWPGDDSLPAPIQRLLPKLSPYQRCFLLPPEGHFQVSVSVLEERNTTRVHITAYSHTRFGTATVAKIKSAMEGEVTRSNRRWRRKLKRMEQEQQGNETTKMDLS